MSPLQTQHRTSIQLNARVILIVSIFPLTHTHPRSRRSQLTHRRLQKSIRVSFPGTENRAKLRVANINLLEERYDVVVRVCHVLKVIEGLKFERDDKLYSRCSKIHERPALSASEICRRCSLEKESLKLCSSFGNKFERRAIAAWTFFLFPRKCWNYRKQYRLSPLRNRKQFRGQSNAFLCSPGFRTVCLPEYDTGGEGFI